MEHAFIMVKWVFAKKADDKSIQYVNENRFLVRKLV